MVFVQSWDETDPDGATILATDIDLKIKQDKIATRERISNITGVVLGGMNTDPLVPTKYGTRVLIDTNAIRTPIFDIGNSFVGSVHIPVTYSNGNRQKININSGTWIPPFILAGSEGSDFVLKVTFGASASITWPSNIKFTSGTPVTFTPSGISLFTFYSLDGTNLLCSLVGTAVA